MKVLLQHDGTLCLAAHVGSNSVVETLIQKGVGKKYICLPCVAYVVQMEVPGQNICIQNVYVHNYVLLGMLNCKLSSEQEALEMSLATAVMFSCALLQIPTIVFVHG